MKQPKQHFTLTSLCVVLLATLSVVGGCSTESIDPGAGTDDGTPMPLTICATASSFDEALTVPADRLSSSVTRTPTQDGNTATFNTGDAIGIFIVKDGAIIDGVNNMKFTYQAATADVEARWTPPAGSQIYYYAGATYIAYFPYTNGVTIDPSQSTADIIVSLSNNALLQPAADQSTAASYAASDLMTASGTPVTGSSDAETILTLNFTHSYCQLTVVPRIAKGCIAPVGGGFTYRAGSKAPVPDVNVRDVVINGVPAYRVTADESYRVIVKPTSASSQMQGSYTSEEAAMVFTSDVYADGFAAGNSYRVNSDSPFAVEGQDGMRPLAPGDFVFHGTNGIEVYPGNGVPEGDKIPDYAQAIGIVVTCDKSRMTDKACSDNSWNHAYVMGLEDCGSELNWGPSWSSDEDVLPNMTRANGAENDMNGYAETEAMLAERASKGDLGNYDTFKAINDYRTSNPVPSDLSDKRSPWFIPSVGQWFDVMANLCGRSPKTFRVDDSENWIDSDYGTEMWNKINNQLNKVNKPLTLILFNSGVFFMCSSEGEGGLCWNAIWMGNRVSLMLSSKSSGQNYKPVVRPFFAF
ncbi:fimbrillin family protein [Bacteroides thetaiotaomicron]|uniref:fimbrillin family protein n=1 Tax=Bacteroides thetaiotaomicron TaxID=818 RepID=UPI0039B53889